MEFNHVSVLLNETIESLNIKPDGIYVDGTLGGAGHSFVVVRSIVTVGVCNNPFARTLLEEHQPVADGFSRCR